MKLKLWFKIFQQTKTQFQMASQADSVTHLLFWNSSYKVQRKEHSQVHSTKLPSPWYQYQTKMSHKRKLQVKLIDEYKYKYAQQNTNPQSILKGSYTMIPEFFYTDKSVWYTTLSNWRIKLYNYLNSCGTSFCKI